MIQAMVRVLPPLPVVVGIVFVVMETTALPVEQVHPRHAVHYDPLENHNVEMPINSMLIEGDVKISFADMIPEMGSSDGTEFTLGSGFGTLSATNSQRRNSVSTSDLFWTNGNVPYELDPALNDTELQTIHAAMSFITSATEECVKFHQRLPNDLDFIFITSSLSGCYSEVGRQGRGNQTVSVSRASDCVTRGIVMHELLHVFGFWHEHTRQDRDRYITILHHNIRFDRKTDFVINKNSQNIVTAYDYYSVLHYKTNQFSVSDHLKTIQILDPNVDERLVGQRFNLSTLDVLRIKLLYGCSEFTSTQSQPKPGIPKRDIVYTEMTPKSESSELGIRFIEGTQSALPERVLSTSLNERTEPKTTIKSTVLNETEILPTEKPSTKRPTPQLNEEQFVDY